MARGHAQKSVSAKKRDGDYVPQNPDPDPVESMDCPEWMGEFGTALWESLSEELIKHKVLTEWDRSSFELLCISYNNAREANSLLQSDGITITNPQSGLIKTNPALDIFTKANAAYCKLAELFGLSPMSRKRIDVNLSSPKTKKNKFDGLKG